MRQIGTLPRNLDPRRLADRLLSLSISTRIDERPDGWVIWVHNEDHLLRAREELDAYLKNPEDPIYREARQSAEEVRREARKLDKRYQKNVRDLTGNWDQPNFRRRPLTTALIVISVAVFLLSDPHSPKDRVMDTLAFSSEVIDEHHHRRLQGFDDIQHGEVWRLVTPIFLHFGIAHLVFNMWALSVLGSLIEFRRGTKVLATVVILSAVLSNVGQFAYELSSSHGPVIFGGMSGVVYALFGYIWMKGRFAPEQGMMLNPSSVQLMLFWLVLCFTGRVGDIANAAHLVGLVVGMWLGVAWI